MTAKAGIRTALSRRLKSPVPKRKPRSAPAPAIAAPPAKLLDRIESLLDAMRPSEQTVGRYVLSHPNLVISLSFPEIARTLGKSEDASRMQYARAMTALTLALARTPAS